MAEEEKTEDEAGNGLSDVAEGEVLAARFASLRPTPQTFSVAVGVLLYLTESGSS